MPKYDLGDAIERLQISEDFDGKILYIHIPANLEVAGGLAFTNQNKYFIFSSGHQVITDFRLAHEVLGHGMQNEFYKDLPLIKRRQKIESDADTVALETMLKLEQSFPDEGYLAFFDEYINGVVQRRKGIVSKNPVLRLYQKQKDFFYNKEMDIDKLISMRNVLF